MTPPPPPPNALVHDASLRAYNTFGLGARARRYYRATGLGALREALRVEAPRLVLGGGTFGRLFQLLLLRFGIGLFRC